MRNVLLLLVVPLVLLGCASPDPSTARDDVGGSPLTPSAASPAASGEVVTDGLVTVLDDGGGPELCVAVAESLPPQCSGPAVLGWDWADQGRYAERASGVRWGDFALRGTWDGVALTLVEAVPAALYDARPVGGPDLPTPAVDLSDAELDAIQADLMRTLPGARTSEHRDGRVVVTVTYDDGSLQEQMDAEHGAGVVVVRSQLRDVTR